MALLQLPQWRRVRAGDLGPGPGWPGFAQLHALRAGQSAVCMATQNQTGRQGAVDLLVGWRAQPLWHHSSRAGRWDKERDDERDEWGFAVLFNPINIPSHHSSASFMCWKFRLEAFTDCIILCLLLLCCIGLYRLGSDYMENRYLAVLLWIKLTEKRWNMCCGLQIDVKHEFELYA